MNANKEENETDDKEEAEETLAGTQSNISSARKEAHENLQEEAKRMKLISDHILRLMLEVMSLYLFRMWTEPQINRTKADLRNIVVVLDKNEGGLYKIGTKYGVVPMLYCR
jgi:hypothetical protein